MKKQCAFSLIEIALVICVAAIIMLMAARQYTKYSQMRNMAVLNNSVETLLNGMQGYLGQTCSVYLQDFVKGGNTLSALPQTPQTVSLACLAGKSPCTQAYLEPAVVQNPFNPTAGNKSGGGVGSDSFSMTILANNVPFQIQLTATFPPTMPTAQFQLLAGKLNPASADSGKLTMTWNATANTAVTGDFSTMGLDANLQIATINQLVVQSSGKLGSAATPPAGYIPCTAAETYIYRYLKYYNGTSSK